MLYKHYTFVREIYADDAVGLNYSRVFIQLNTNCEKINTVNKFVTRQIEAPPSAV